MVERVHQRLDRKSIILLVIVSKHPKRGQTPISSRYWCLSGSGFSATDVVNSIRKEYFRLVRQLIQILLKLGSSALNVVASGLLSTHFIFLACCDEPVFMFATREWLRFSCRLVVRTSFTASPCHAQPLTEHEMWSDYDFFFFFLLAMLIWFYKQFSTCLTLG